MNALDIAIESTGGVSKLAAALGLNPNVVGNWRIRGQVPAERCVAIEEATKGKVTRYDLRPDVFGAPAVARRARAASGEAAEAAPSAVTGGA